MVRNAFLNRPIGDIGEMTSSGSRKHITDITATDSSNNLLALMFEPIRHSLICPANEANLI